MPGYRLYCLDGAGKFTQAHDIIANCDADAIALAREMKIPSACEIWERGRMVAKLEPHQD